MVFRISLVPFDCTHVVILPHGGWCSMLPVTQLTDHYPDPAAMRADLIVHIIGLAFALLGGGILMGLAVGLGPSRQAASVSDLCGRPRRHARAVDRLQFRKSAMATSSRRF